MSKDTQFFKNPISKQQAIELIEAYAQGGGSGEIDSVVAGDFININNTDPANPIVSAKVNDASSLNTELLSAKGVNDRIGNYISSAVSTFTIKGNVNYYTATLPAFTYNNGTAGVGATITGNAVGILTIDGNATVLGQAFVYNSPINKEYNGLYQITTEGTAGVAFVATRTTNFNSNATILPNSTISIISGVTYAGTSWQVINLAQPVVVGTTPIEFEETGNGVYAFSPFTFTTSNTLSTPPRVTVITPMPQQINGQLIGGYGVWIERLSFVGTVPVDLELTNLVGITRITGAPSISTFGSGVLSFPALKSVYDNGFFDANATITSLLVPLLEIITVPTTLTLTYASVTVLNFASLRSMPATTLSGNTLLTTFSLPVAEYIYGTLTSTSGNGALTDFTLGTSLKYFNSNINFTSCALNQASVDGILAALVALDGTSGKNLYGTGRTVTITGTSSTPSATGLLDKATLVGRGVTVTTN